MSQDTEMNNREFGMLVVVDILKVATQITEILQANSKITAEHLQEIKRLRNADLNMTVARIDEIIARAEAALAGQG